LVNRLQASSSISRADDFAVASPSLSRDASASELRTCPVLNWMSKFSGCKRSAARCETSVSCSRAILLLLRCDAIRSSSQISYSRCALYEFSQPNTQGDSLICSRTYCMRDQNCLRTSSFPGHTFESPAGRTLLL
jgi:hypothetical protein